MKPTPEVKDHVRRSADVIPQANNADPRYLLDKMAWDEKVPLARLIPSRFTKYVPPHGGPK
jgi:hypothetical protein